jgi:hypothetical protein
MVPVKWVDDWPVINEGRKVCLGFEHLASEDQVWRDSFSATTLQLGWYRKSRFFHEFEVGMLSSSGF